MDFFAPFTIPFLLGAVVMFSILIFRYCAWFLRLEKSDKKRLLYLFNPFVLLRALWRIIQEALLHVSIWKKDPRLGYMHSSLAFGWFLLIAVGWVETIVLVPDKFVPLQGHVFFRYFAKGDVSMHSEVFSHLMDFLLLVVLSGVLLAWLKRFSSRSLGIKRTTRHVRVDRIAVFFLWFIFPLRFLSESFSAALYNEGGFATMFIGSVFSHIISREYLGYICETSWWLYSITLGGFFLFMPFSRYMHIFTEVPLILLKSCNIHPSSEKQTTVDKFNIQACSRCGICIDACQLQSPLSYTDVQSVYYLRDRRYRMLSPDRLENCLMCGRCEQTCPVGIDILKLRQNSRIDSRTAREDAAYSYLEGQDKSQGEGKVGFFMGCMTSLTPSIRHSMERIFSAVKEDVWWADRDGGVCCGRPLKLSGDIIGARNVMNYNKSLFEKHQITTLVTSCPICYKVFKEDYNLQGIEVLHHSEYIHRLLSSDRLQVKHLPQTFTYHDPCELGRGSGIYSQPREIIKSIGELQEPKHHGKNSLCCGASLANTRIDFSEQMTITSVLASELEQTGASCIVTSCPLCKKTISKVSDVHVSDLSEVVASSIQI